MSTEEEFNRSLAAFKKAGLDKSETSFMFGKIISTKHQVTVPRSSFSLFTWWKRVLALLVVIFFGFGSLAYASLGALPGDSLYGFKTKVTEPVQAVAYALVGEGDSYQEQLALRRLDEMKQLNASGQLSSEQKASLTESFVSMESSQSLDVKAKLNELENLGLDLDLGTFEFGTGMEVTASSSIAVPVEDSQETVIGDIETELKIESIDAPAGGIRDSGVELEQVIVF